MPSQMEFEDKDVDLAVKKAGKKLNLPAEKIKYTVISYGSTGIFGLVGAKKARIRVTVPDAVPQKPQLSQPVATPEPDLASGIEPDINLPPEPPTPETSTEIATQKNLQEQDQAILQAGKDVLQRIVDAITSEASIIVEGEGETIRFNISGGNSAALIGKRGQTLDAIQYLIEKIVNRQNDDRIRIQIDIEGYLKNRKNNLEELAGSLAAKVKQTGKPASAGHLNAQDRRIVHMALKDDALVRTQSMGTGIYRNLMIFPKKNTQKKKST